MENYPITQVIPRTRVLSEVPIYLAYNHGNSGHYNLAVEVTGTQSNSATTKVMGKEPDKHLQVEVDVPSQHEAGCSCGRGNAGKTGKSEFCKHYRSRCPCFRNVRSCNEKCSCRSCANPFGTKTQEKEIFGPLPRKRQKQDLQHDIKQTDKGYMEKKAEEPIGWFEDELYVIEALFLYLFYKPRYNPGQDLCRVPQYSTILLGSDLLSKCTFSASKILVHNSKETTRNKGQIKG